MIVYICREKELRQKELMKMMSVTESDIGWSWFISYLVVYAVAATLCAVVSMQLYENSDPLILWVFWIFTFVSLIVFSMFVAASSAKTTRVRTLPYSFIEKLQIIRNLASESHDYNVLCTTDCFGWFTVYLYGSLLDAGR